MDAREASQRLIGSVVQALAITALHWKHEGEGFRCWLGDYFLFMGVILAGIAFCLLMHLVFEHEWGYINYNLPSGRPEDMAADMRFIAFTTDPTLQKWRLWHWVLPWKLFRRYRVMKQVPGPFWGGKYTKIE